MFPIWNGRRYEPQPRVARAPDAGDYNLFRYCHNDPLDFIDPTGEFAEVTVEGNQISIRVPIHFSGDGVTSKLTETYSRAIERAWSGKFGQYKVMTKVDTSGEHGKTNKVKIVDDETFRSKVINHIKGIWNNSGDKAMAAHEGGHLMGLPDRYTDVKGRDGTVIGALPKDGGEKGIMGPNMSKPPTAQDIKEITENKHVNRIINLETSR